MTRYAILISCEEYTEFDNIFYCHNDSFLVFETLTTYCDYNEENIKLFMIYPGADENDIDYLYDIIKSIADKMDNTDTLLLYFAGHGILIETDAFLLLPDSKRTNIPGTALSLQNIADILRTSNGSTFRIFDACHAGVDVRGSDSKNFVNAILQSSWVTFAACSEYESSHPDSELEQGIFTYHISDAIRKWNINTEIVIENLKIQVCNEIKKWGQEKGLTQTPTLNGSIVGNISFATRNYKTYEDISNLNKITTFDGNELHNIAIEEESIMAPKNELVIIEDNDIMLWSSNAGISIPKSADIDTVLAKNIQLKQREVHGICQNYSSENYEFASEPIWNRAMNVLRKRVLAFGVEFVSDMVNVNNLEYVRNLPEFEVINLAMELGFINSTGRLRLMQASELINHYLERDIDDEMTKSESDSIIRACMQYVLGIEESEINVEYNDFRERLKSERFDEKSTIMQMLNNSPYFYKRTTLRTFVNLIGATEGVEFENVIENFTIALEQIWDALSSDDKYFMGITYSKYANKGEEKYISPIKNALLRVGGFDYVPENLRSLSFINVAKNLKSVHYAFNNFYNEPSVVRTLDNMGSKIPRAALKEVISSILLVVTGNAYGKSEDAAEPAINILGKLSESDWTYYIEKCFPYDEDVLYNISFGDLRTKRWCDIIKEFELDNITFTNSKVQRFIQDSVSGDKNNVKAIANTHLKKIGKI